MKLSYARFSLGTFTSDAKKAILEPQKVKQCTVMDEERYLAPVSIGGRQIVLFAAPGKINLPKAFYGIYERIKGQQVALYPYDLVQKLCTLSGGLVSWVASPSLEKITLKVEKAIH